MAVTLQQFVDNLVESGLMRAEEVEVFLECLPLEQRPTRPEALAKELYRQGKLTKFQAQAIYQGKTRGLVIGNYVVLDRLGKGGMGQVYKARHRRLDRVVALKVLPSALAKSPDAVKRFHREARAAARLSHPNIVVTLDADDEKGLHFLAMECVDGADLASRVRDHGPMTVKNAVDYALQAARGLAYAHQQGVIHRDVKPSNLLLDSSGTVKVLDIGLARIEQSANQPGLSSDDLTRSGEIMGTVDYMSPEQSVNTKNADARSDVYSLGCTLFYLLAGRSVYAGETLIERILAHREQPIPSLRAIRRDVPEAVDAVFCKMVAKQAGERYATMNEAIAGLEQSLSAPAPASCPETLTLQPAPRETVSLRGLLAPETPSPTPPPPLPEAKSFLDELLEEPVVLPDRLWQRSRRRFLTPARKRQLVLFGAVAAASALVFVLFALLLTSADRRGKDMPPLPPGEGRSEGSATQVDPRAAIDAKRSPASPLPKDKRTAPPLAIAPFDATTARNHQKAWADYLGVPVEFTNSIGMKFVLIPPGEFHMGASAEEIDHLSKSPEPADALPDLKQGLAGEGPRHRVRITRPYYLGTTETTQARYTQIVGSCPNPAGSADGNLPVDTVAWIEAVAFCQKLSGTDPERLSRRVYRLPTEAEWEYACRAGSSTRYHFGDDAQQLAAHAWCMGNAGDQSQPVGQKRPNAWGLYDMHGSLWEWCADWHASDYYQKAPTDDPTGPSAGSVRVLRGGSYHWDDPRLFRSAFRPARAPEKGFRDYGFRVACEIPGTAGQAPRESESDVDFAGVKLPFDMPDSTPPSDGPATSAKPSELSPDGWSEPVNLGPTVNSSDHEQAAVLSPDGRQLLFCSNRPGGQGGWDLWMCTRRSLSEPFRDAVNLGPTVNSGADDREPALSSNGLTLFFSSNRPGGHGGFDVWSATRPSLDAPFTEPINLGPAVNSSADDACHALSADGLTLLFRSNRPGGQGGHDLWTATRPSVNTPFTEPVNLGPTVNSSADDGNGILSADGLTLLFQSNRPGGLGGWDVWMSARASTADRFGELVNLGPPVNSSADDGLPAALSADGLTLIICSDRPGGHGGHDLWICTRSPRAGTAPSSSSPHPSPLPKGEGTEPPPPAVAPFDAKQAKNHQEAWAKHLGMQVEMTNSIGMKFVLVPPGEFHMGSTQQETDQFLKEAKDRSFPQNYSDPIISEMPRHGVRISHALYLGIHEATVGQFRTFVQATGFKTDAEKDPKGGWAIASGQLRQVPGVSWQRPPLPQNDDHPVVFASWNDASEFCGWLSKKEGTSCRLPTEAEWEYACRAGSTTRYHFGDQEAGLPDYGWWGGNSGGWTHAVGGKPANAFGLRDMHGNVWEWCSDWYSPGYYSQSSSESPTGPASGHERVFRGGGMSYFPEAFFRCAFRGSRGPNFATIDLGFRVAFTVGPAATPAPASASPDGWSSPVNLGPTVNSSADDVDPAVSADGLMLVFHSDRPGGQGGADLWMCTRTSRDEPFGRPVNLGATVNSSALEVQPGLSADGLTLLFSSDRPGGQGGRDLWMCGRASRGERFAEPVNLGPVVNSSDDDGLPFLSADGLTLLFHSSRPGGQGGLDVWACARASPDKPFAQPVNLGPTVNSSANDGAPAIYSDGLKLYFASDRPGGYGDYDIWMCMRASLDMPFGQPINLGPTVNSAALDGAPKLSADGLTLYFCSNRPGRQGTYDLWMCTRSPRAGTAPSASSPHPSPLPKGEGTEPPPPAIAPFDAKQAKQYQQVWAKHLGVPVENSNSIGMRLVLIPPGEFEMGSTEQEVEEMRQLMKAVAGDASLGDLCRNRLPRHPVRITKPFCLGKHEVTVGQFLAFVEAAKYQSEAEKRGKATEAIDFTSGKWVTDSGFTWQKPGFPQAEDHPVSCLNWDDAAAFCRWLSEKEKTTYRLPTEAEWEYACRAGTATKFHTGDHPRTLRGFANLPDLALRKVFPKMPANFPWNDGFAYTSPAGRFRPNAFGLHDMHGNVCELCADWYAADYYARSPKDDPPGPETGSSRVIRSSAWLDLHGTYLPTCSACRGSNPSNCPWTIIGFRVVKVVGPP